MYVSYPKLETVLKGISKDTIIHIGAKSSFFFIGTKEEFRRDIDGISEQFLEDAKTNLEIKNQQMKNFNEAVETIKNMSVDSTDRDSVKAFTRQAEYLASLSKTAVDNTANIPKLENYISNFKPLRKRSVVEQYNKIDPEEGIIIIVQGDEIARFWTKDEYDKVYNRSEENKKSA